MVFWSRFRDRASRSTSERDFRSYPAIASRQRPANARDPPYCAGTTGRRRVRIGRIIAEKRVDRESPASFVSRARARTIRRFHPGARRRPKVVGDARRTRETRSDREIRPRAHDCTKRLRIRGGRGMKSGGRLVRRERIAVRRRRRVVVPRTSAKKTLEVNKRRVRARPRLFFAAPERSRAVPPDRTKRHDDARGERRESTARAVPSSKSRRASVIGRR